MIRTLLFDVDGVLIRGQMASRYFNETYGIPADRQVAFYRGPFLDCLVGKKDMYDVLPHYLKDWGWTKSVSEFVREWFEFERNVDETLRAYIQSLRQQGIPCYVATNQEKHRASYMLGELGFKDSFDGLFASSHLGYAKPDTTFFTSILTKLNIADASEVLFWDDAAANVDAARSVGLQAEVFTDFDSFAGVMRSTYRLAGIESL